MKAAEHIEGSNNIMTAADWQNLKRASKIDEHLKNIEQLGKSYRNNNINIRQLVEGIREQANRIARA